MFTCSSKNECSLWQADEDTLVTLTYAENKIVIAIMRKYSPCKRPIKVYGILKCAADQQSLCKRRRMKVISGVECCTFFFFLLTSLLHFNDKKIPPHFSISFKVNLQTIEMTSLSNNPFNRLACNIMDESPLIPLLSSMLWQRSNVYYSFFFSFCPAAQNKLSNHWWYHPQTGRISLLSLNTKNSKSTAR